MWPRDEMRGRQPARQCNAEKRCAERTRSGSPGLQRQLALGSVRITDILAAPPACTQTESRVDELLLALPKYGPLRVGRLLSNCRISAAKTVAGLSDRQRQELIARLAS